MMRLFLIASCCVFFSLEGSAQLVLSRQVIGAAAINTSNASTTAGQVGNGTGVGTNAVLTAGFEQPSDDPFSALVEVVFEDCWNGSNASIQVTDNGVCGDITVTVSQDGDEIETSGLSEGTYSVQVEAANGCFVFEEVEVVAPSIEPCDLNIPNTFTPNDDMVHDLWIISGINEAPYNLNDVSIVNRWGQPIWKASNYDNDTVVWDGKDDAGTLVPEGAYYYVFTFSDGSTAKGHINVLR